MNGRRLFIDTAFVQALFNQADALHDQARAHALSLDAAAELWTTEAVLVEVGNALSAINRAGAAAFIEQAYRTTQMRVVPVDTLLLQRAAQLYRDRPDKRWGMTDCISFIVMGDQGLTDALTTDQHFAQAGFNPLLRQSGV
ncbi:MAG: PIN domain-containing protein [Tepidisphaeraceae bacterium]